MNDGGALWIKIVTRIFEDPKIVMIETSYPEAYGILILWFKLLTLAGEQNRSGTVYFTDAVPFTADLLAAKWRCKPTLVQLALGVFQKLGMIGIDQEGTIYILNWSKYQDEEGLARIRDSSLLRLQNSADKAARRRELAPAELEQKTKKTREQSSARVKRFRERRRRNGSGTCNAEGNAALQPLHALHGVTRNGHLPGDVTAQNQNKNQRENFPPTVPPGGTDLDASLDFDQAKQWLNKLFGRTRAWSDEEDDLLTKLLPISDEDRKLIQWGYSLRRDAEGWALADGDRASKPKQSLIVLLREFSSELDKWRLARRNVGYEDSEHKAPAPAAWTDERLEAAIELYGEDVNFARTPFHLITNSAQREIDQHAREMMRRPKETAE